MPSLRYLKVNPKVEKQVKGDERVRKKASPSVKLQQVNKTN